MVLENLPNPIEKAKDVRDTVEAKNHKKLFYDEQFEKMVGNGNVEKAVELVWDEARNLDVRISKEMTPEKLAEYCLERCLERIEQDEDAGNFEKAVEELKDQYNIEAEADE